MKKRIVRIVLMMFAISSLLLAGCGSKEESVLNPEDPVVITFWHSYNNLARTMLENMIIEFNDTIGTEKGIVVESYGFGEQAKLEEALFNSANGVIGSEEMPDMFMAYSDNAYRINEIKPLVDFKEYFSEKELAEYREEFLQEGIWPEGEALKTLPIAKSTELLYVNKTDWDKFAKDNAATIENKTIEEAFATWESIVETAELYYNKTDGRPFLGFNLNNDLMHVTATQMGAKPYVQKEDGVEFVYSKEFAKRIWEICYVPHINGWFESSFYNQDSMREGGLLSYIGSSAGSGFFPGEVTIEDENIVYPIECEVIEYPTFEKAEKYLTQRGANVCVTVSEKKNEYAAAEFIKWFTKEENNIEFAVATGYMPVKKAAIQNKEEIIANMGESKNKNALQNTVDTTLKATENLKFVIKTPFKNSYEANAEFSFGIFNRIEKDLVIKAERIQAGEDVQAVIDELTSDQMFEKWYEELTNSVKSNIG